MSDDARLLPLLRAAYERGQADERAWWLARWPRIVARMAEEFDLGVRMGAALRGYYARSSRPSSTARRRPAQDDGWDGDGELAALREAQERYGVRPRGARRGTGEAAT